MEALALFGFIYVVSSKMQQDHSEIVSGMKNVPSRNTHPFWMVNEYTLTEGGANPIELGRINVQSMIEPGSVPDQEKDPVFLDPSKPLDNFGQKTELHMGNLSNYVPMPDRYVKESGYDGTAKDLSGGPALDLTKSQNAKSNGWFSKFKLPTFSNGFVTATDHVKFTPQQQFGRVGGCDGLVCEPDSRVGEGVRLSRLNGFHTG